MFFYRQDPLAVFLSYRDSTKEINGFHFQLTTAAGDLRLYVLGRLPNAIRRPASKVRHEPRLSGSKCTSRLSKETCVCECVCVCVLAFVVRGRGTRALLRPKLHPATQCSLL